MLTSLNNQWFKAMLNQVWIYQQTTEVMAKCIDPDLLLDPQAMTDYCLHPTEKRLNPLEFHGKRRSSGSEGSPTSNHERSTVPRSQKHRRRS